MSEQLPVTRLLMGTGNVTGYIARVEIREGFGVHSMALIDVSSAPTSRKPYAELTPVTLDYGRAPADLVRWNGYVHHSSEIASADTQHVVVRYVCIGTALPMNTQRTRSWKNVSPTSIVRQVGRENGLRTIISPSARRLTYWAQAGQSDFKLVNDLAAETGYRFWVEGTTLYFLDPRILLLGQQSQDIPVFSKNQQPGIQDSLQSLSILTGTMIPRSNGTTGTSAISGLDAKTGKVLKASSAADAGTAPFLNHITTSRAVDNYADAQALMEARTLASRGWITMQATLYGTAKIAPGTLVGIGGNSVSADNKGRWMVTNTKHLINRDKKNAGWIFTTTVDAERDQPYAVTFRSDANKRFKFDTVPAVLRNGQFWESSLLEDINVG
ncbi:phage protein D [Streptomyces sp. BK022]|uniref:contractile injection system protein, VgrG/Pvc8 family n=1 Tax=Streptomyces sp. BK022 TaxID=2512123 RepID=UPI00102881AA|nr:contractile injection system protein, VgrG/Pvc8 family [Streptomyces sp. BK022]RZU35938.1 phage protein D [Streptomyces sp. BK022]